MSWGGGKKNDWNEHEGSVAREERNSRHKEAEQSAGLPFCRLQGFSHSRSKRAERQRKHTGKRKAGSAV